MLYLITYTCILYILLKWLYLLFGMCGDVYDRFFLLVYRKQRGGFYIYSESDISLLLLLFLKNRLPVAGVIRKIIFLKSCIFTGTISILWLKTVCETLLTIIVQYFSQIGISK